MPLVSTRSLVGEGVGVALIDPVTAIDYEDRNVVLKPFRPRVEFDLAIIVPRYQPMSRQCRAFAARLEESLGALRQEFEQRGF